MMMLHLTSTIVVKYDTKLTRSIDFKATVHKKKKSLFTQVVPDFYDFLYSAEHKNKLFWSVFFFVGPDNESQQGLCGFEPHWLLLYWQKQFMFMFCRKRKVIQVGTTKLSLRTVGTSKNWFRIRQYIKPGPAGAEKSIHMRCAVSWGVSVRYYGGCLFIKSFTLVVTHIRLAESQSRLG